MRVLLAAIQEQLDQMKTLILRSGITTQALQSIIPRVQLLKSDEEVQSFLESLQGLQEWRDAYRVWVLPSSSNPEKAEEIWNRYDMLGLTGHREQDMLAEKLALLKVAFRKLIKDLPRAPSKTNPAPQGT